MYGFVKRDKKWDIPGDSQVLGDLKIDQKNKSGTYRLYLPAQPVGTLVDVDNNGRKDTGVQVFAVSYWPNLSGGPYSEGDDKSQGWPSYLASTINDPENEDEVTGGKLVVWAPDGQQQFPTGFGADGLLFTKDDPVGPIPAGYSIVDLNTKPFTVSQKADSELTLYEPNDITIKDFSDLSYNEAFQKTFETVRTDYAFNGIQGKEPAWDQLYAELAPRVDQAQKNKDGKAFYLAMRDFTFAFHDGHVGLSGGQFANQVFQEQSGGGYGINVRKLDDGRFIIAYLTKGSPADQAGIALGAEVTAFNNQPIAQAVAAVKPGAGPFSTDFGREYQQQRYLTRAPVGTQATITFTNPGQASRTATMTAVEERESFAASSIYAGFDPTALPVEYKILDSGLGYIKINSNDDDLNLIVRVFERALNIFQQSQLPGVIIDLRRNPGGAPLDLAGYLSDKTIPLAQLEYYSEKTKKFEPEGVPDEVDPKETRYHFNKIALLVGQACASACEIEAYGFSQVPGMQVVGQYPTAGIEAEVARGQFKLPDGLSLQVPTGRFIKADGSLFLEGKGVQPTVRVPINEQTILSQDDVVLQTAEKAIAPEAKP